MAQSLIEHGQIKTTLPKAKELVPFIEPIITQARRAPSAAPRDPASQRSLHDRPQRPRPARGRHRRPKCQGNRSPLQGPPGRLHPHHQDLRMAIGDAGDWVIVQLVGIGKVQEKLTTVRQGQEEEEHARPERRGMGVRHVLPQIARDPQKSRAFSLPPAPDFDNSSIPMPE